MNFINHPLLLPRSKATIEFCTPTFETRTNVLKNYDKNSGMTTEDLLAISCITKINGTAVTPLSNPIDFIKGCPLYDYQYYLEVFFNICMLDDEARKQAQEVSKKILSGEDIPTTPATVPAIQKPGKAAA